MFEIIPCVDIQGGKAVRLFEGKPDKETVYFASPLEAALHWTRLGATWLHLVDLDAALGRGSNQDLIRRIAQQVTARVEVGGGIRSLASARGWLETAHRIILGTAAVQDPKLLKTLLEEFGSEKIVVSIDAKEGRVAVKGWLELSTLSATELARQVMDEGVRQVIYTDISRDGTLKGVNPEPVAIMRKVFPHTLLAGGGVASDADLELYEQLGLNGAIVGRALYEGRVSYPRTSRS